MKITRKFIEEHDRMLTKVSGGLCDTQLARYMTVICREKGARPSGKQLIDLTEVGCINNLSVRGVTNYSKREPERPSSQLALLVGDCAVHYGMARAYQTFAVEKRLSVEIFQEKDAAFAWFNKKA